MASVASSYVVYILRCADSSFYTGMTTDLDMRLAEHRDGIDPGSYTHARRPVQVVWSRNFQTHDEAFRCERQIKGWRRSKKLALINGDLAQIHNIVRLEWEGEDLRR